MKFGKEIDDIGNEENIMVFLRVRERKCHGK